MPTAEYEEFATLARLPAAGDNAAIAVRDLAAGTRFRYGNSICTLSHSILEGHRFAVEPVVAGADLTSWNLPFGRALRRIEPGEYLCNAGMLGALHVRAVPFELPRIANFANAAAPFELDAAAFIAGRQVAAAEQPATFAGFARGGGRGTGTRNVIVILATSSTTSSFARRLEDRLRGDAAGLANVDDVVAVTHTEGGERGEHPNNLEFVLRTLAGFVVHPNVAAILAIDDRSGFVDNARLSGYLAEHGYPLDAVPHRFYTLERDLGASLDECAAIVRAFYAEACEARRTEHALSGLKVALQCGGSDAFSGVSGNPLAASVARELIRHGGSASLAETDELIGAEHYVLDNVRDLETTRRFLARIAAFRERIGWHGHSAEGNPSGGNLYRGLYNISLKSLGAARKKAPDVRLDHVVGYAERMHDSGFYFMDSPGNDLESIAGQVASGCNLVFFITGNGSITNFPFVPTLKFVTTTRRFELLADDMDVNAGRYQDGESLDALTTETFDLARAVAAGRSTAGERAGHAQVSIWRDWRQTDDRLLTAEGGDTPPSGNPVTVRANPGRPLPPAPGRPRRIGLVAPTSLCSGQIALQIAAQLNESSTSADAVDRFVALPHTEGCGASSGDNEVHLLRTLLGHLTHPLVGPALLLEHGCERTHNDLVRRFLATSGIDPERFGYASIQLDGGIARVSARVREWFEARVAAPLPAVDDNAWTVGLTSEGAIGAFAARVLAQLVARIVGNGGCVVLPEAASVLDSDAFLPALGLESTPAPTLEYSQVPRVAGLHVMATPGPHVVEALTGLGGAGVRCILAHVATVPVQAHPLVPTLGITSAGAPAARFAADLDYEIDPNADETRVTDSIVDRVADSLSGNYLPIAAVRGYTDFQVTRGRFGVSL